MPKKRPGAGPSVSKVSTDQLTNLQSPELAPYWLSALIESADDAIISKTLEGIITSWNAGAERIFGYTADEVIGKPITILIPKDHEDEEPAILARLRAGQRMRMQKVVDTGPISIPGDPVRLQQGVWNLLSNAIKFIPRGGRVQIRSGRVHPGARDLMPSDDITDRLDGLRILAVDDEADTRELLRQGLEYCGAKVKVVGSVAEAIDALMSSVPDILISDIGMSGTDGYDLIRQVRALPPDRGTKVAAIALTAYTRIEDRLQALRAGYDMHVPKPVELAELCAVAASVARRNS